MIRDIILFALDISLFQVSLDIRSQTDDQNVRPIKTLQYFSVYAWGKEERQLSLFVRTVPKHMQYAL